MPLPATFRTLASPWILCLGTVKLKTGFSFVSARDFPYLCLMEQSVDETLIRYVETEILPRYEAFDKAHQVDHARTVIRESLRLAQYYDVVCNVVYAVAAYHDTGLVAGRVHHHEVSARIVRDDRNLRRWFTEQEIDTTADAVEDHRASSGTPPRSIYGCIVAEADRVIDCDTTLRRTVQYGLQHEPQLDREGQYARFVAHLHEKYAAGGYLRLWLPESGNVLRLEALRRRIADKEALRRDFDRLYDEEYSRSVSPKS